MAKRKRTQLWAVQCPIAREDGSECGTPIQRTEAGTLDDGVAAHCELVHRIDAAATRRVVAQIARRVDKATSDS